MMSLRVFMILICLPALAWLPATGSAQSANNPADSDPAALLARARTAMGFPVVQGRVLHLRAATAVEQPYQSDRTYPPFFSNMGVQETWFNVDTRALREQERSVFPGAGPTSEVVTMDDGVNATVARVGRTTAVHRRQARSRYLEPWAVIADWSVATDVSVAAPETYRDYRRLVLVRRTADGAQRLFLDPKSGYPVKLDLVEPHYLWGQQHVEYVWSTWIASGGLSYPGAAFRLVDGEVEYSRTNGDCELVAADAAPSLAAPAAPSEPPAELPVFLQPSPPTPVRIADKVWLLSNRGYNEVVAEIGGEIFLFDSTQGEARARLDAQLVRELFPGPHKVNVVVTDLAWPHIAGVRYWVAEGATIISHRASREFLQRVIDRRWTDAPDLLEQKRTKDPRSVRLNFVPIDQPTNHASGNLCLIPIDGIASEGALMAFLLNDGFLWASDYIQTLDSPSQYAREVIDAVERVGVKPQRVAAEHLPITPWSEVLKAQTALKSQ